MPGFSSTSEFPVGATFSSSCTTFVPACCCITTGCCPNVNLPIQLQAIVSGTGNCDGNYILQFDPAGMQWVSTLPIGTCSLAVLCDQDTGSCQWHVLVNGVRTAYEPLVLSCNPLDLLLSSVPELNDSCSCSGSPQIEIIPAPGVMTKCCAGVPNTCCPDRTLPQQLFAVMHDISPNPGDCSCIDGLSLVFNYCCTDGLGNVAWSTYGISPVDPNDFAFGFFPTGDPSPLFLPNCGPPSPGGPIPVGQPLGANLGFILVCGQLSQLFGFSPSGWVLFGGNLSFGTAAKLPNPPFSPTCHPLFIQFDSGSPGDALCTGPTGTYRIFITE